jgi:hypothetical protein
MRTTDGLTRLYIDSSVVSIPLTAAGTETGGRVLVALTVELDMVVDEVDNWGVVHPTKVIIIDKIATINNVFLFTLITPWGLNNCRDCPFYVSPTLYWPIRLDIHYKNFLFGCKAPARNICLTQLNN